MEQMDSVGLAKLSGKDLLRLVGCLDLHLVRRLLPQERRRPLRLRGSETGQG